MKWQEFIEQLLSDYRLNSLDLEKRTGIPNTIISNIRKGKTKTPHVRTVRMLEAGLGIKIFDADRHNISYRRLDSSDQDEGFIKQEPNVPSMIQEEVLPLWDEIQPRSNNSLFISSRKITFDTEKQFILRINESNGKGMEPLLVPGDFIICDLHEKPVAGDLVAARWEPKQEGVKKLSYMNNDPELIVLSSVTLSGDNFAFRTDQVDLYKVVFIKKK